MRTLNKDLTGKAGKTAVIEGWLHKRRDLGGIAFLILRDRSGLAQVVTQDEKEIDKLKGLQNGTVLSLEGKVVKEPRAIGGVEIHEPKLTIITPVTEVSPIELDKPIGHEPNNLETLFDNRVVSLRNPKEAAVFRIQAELKELIRQYFREHEFMEFNSPKLLSGSTEGGAEVFRLEHFGKEATLAQSAQFYKQIMVGVFERVFEINPTYRAEPSATTRHMTEFIHVDAEMAFVDFNELMVVAGDMVKWVSDNIWKRCKTELELWGAEKPLLGKEIPKFTIAEIHQKYSDSTGNNTVGEDDLRPDEEKWICAYAKDNLGSEAVFVTDWPAHDAKFYHRIQESNPDLAERFDMLFRGIELMTGSMREHRYEALVTQLKEKAKGDPDHPGFKYYLQAFRYGMPPHGGFAMGLERLTAKIIGLNNVKEASLFPRDMNRLAP